MCSCCLLIAQMQLVQRREIVAAKQPTMTMFGGLEQEVKMINIQLKLPDIMVITKIIKN